MNLNPLAKKAPTSVEQVLTAFNTMIGDLMTVKATQSDILIAKSAEVVAAQEAADAAKAEVQRADSVIRKIEQLLA